MLKNLFFKHTLLLLFFLSATACTTTDETESTLQSEPVAQEQQQNKNVEKLRAGEDVTVQTSQGNISVSPTVVAITDAKEKQGSGDAPFYYDPWEDFNRAIFTFNNYSYEYVLYPAAKGYRYIVPAAARDKIGNAFDNIREPLNLLNNLAAGQFKEAGSNLGRFAINSTLGLFGLFDPAKHWFEIDAQRQTLGDTLQHYDVGAGPYLVLPILGPGDSRSAFSLITESFIHPIDQLVDAPESYYIRSFDGFDDYSDQAETYNQLYQQAEDPYIYFRNQYIQGKRRDEYFQYKQVDDDE